MKNCLLVLNPRIIRDSIDSIESLSIPQFWFTAFTEFQLQDAIASVVERTNFDNYIFIADDVIVTHKALDIVTELLLSNEMATGFCRLSRTHELVNLTRSPLSAADEPTMDNYDFFSFVEVQETENVFSSWFGGWCLTGLRRHLLQTIPFRIAATGCHSDYLMSLKLATLGRTFATHRDTFVDHLKIDHNVSLQDGWLVGTQRPTINFKTR